MMKKQGIVPMGYSATWYQSDHHPIVCKEKIKILEENHSEIQKNIQDIFEDAILIGVDEGFMRTILKEIIDKLRSPVV